MKIDFDGNSVIKSILYDYSHGDLPVSPCVSSTSTSCIQTPAEWPSGVKECIFVRATTEEELESDLRKLWSTGVRFQREGTVITYNSHQESFQRARDVVLRCLESGEFHLQKPKGFRKREDIIVFSGIAMNSQIGEKCKAMKFPQANIFQMLTRLGLDRDYNNLFKKFEYMNPFYNAAHHRGTQGNADHYHRIISQDGYLIAIDFFEVVRRVFRWHYEKETGTIPDWDELKPIKYAD